MKVSRPIDLSSSPLAQEEELLRRLQAAEVCSSQRLRLTITGRRLFVDGFVESVDQKFRVERACRELAPESVLVKCLRVAVSEGPPVS